jgi:hypothetical protein
MAIWKIIAASDTYRSLTWVDSSVSNFQLIEAFKGGGPIADSWVPRAVHLFVYEGEEAKPLGDFPSLFGGVPPVFSKRAIEILNPLIADSTEILPLMGLEGEFSVVNVIDVVDCLDHQRSEYIRFESSGRIMHIEHYVFKKDYLKNKHIFRIPEEVVSAVFVSDAFKTLVEQNRLEGLIFKKVA